MHPWPAVFLIAWVGEPSAGCTYLHLLEYTYKHVYSVSPPEGEGCVQGSDFRVKGIKKGTTDTIYTAKLAALITKVRPGYILVQDQALHGTAIQRLGIQ